MLEPHGVNVLAVDDKTELESLVKHSLEEQSGSVLTALSLELAVAVFCKAKLDVLMSDIGLPDGNASQLIMKLREVATSGRVRTPADTFTAYARAQDRERVLFRGDQLHLAKPV